MTLLEHVEYTLVAMALQLDHTGKSHNTRELAEISLLLHHCRRQLQYASTLAPELLREYTDTRSK